MRSWKKEKSFKAGEMMNFNSKRKNRRLISVLLLSLILTLSLTGCEPSKKKVVNSKYYKELKKKNKELKKQIKELEGEVEQENNISEDTKRAEDYLERIGRDRVIKMEVGYADNMEGGEFITDNEAAFSMATAIALRADKCTKYSADQIKKMYGPGYEYILYDEDNACYEIMVYAGNYVVFLDMPDRVYYAYDASALGEAFLHYKEGYPNSKLLHRLADSPLITDSKNNYYDRTTAYKAANAIDRMEKEKTDKKAAMKDWGKSKKGRTWTFYHHGNTMTITLYDRYIRLENMDEKAEWYKASEEDVNKVKEIFEEGKNPGKEEKDASDKDKNSKEQTHEEEMDTGTDSKDQEENTVYYDEEGNEG